MGRMGHMGHKTYETMRYMKPKTIIIPMRSTKTAAILVMVGTGSKYEDKSISGLSHFVEHMLFKGTKKRPSALAISSALDGLGSEYNAFTGKEYTGYWVKAQKDKIEPAMEILSDMFLNSKFKQSEIDREKGVIIEELNMYEDNPLMHIEDVFEQCLYGDTPAGRDTIGTKENILSFKQKDFKKYFFSQYGPANTIICLAGNVNLRKAQDLIKKYFLRPEFLNRGQGFQDKELVVECQTKPQIKIKYKKTDQVHLSLGVRTFAWRYPDELVARMIAAILGGSMSSRLFIALRERRGLAYYVRTSAEFYTDTGYLTTQAGVPVDKFNEAVQIILNEYKKIKRVLVKDKELERVKDLVFGRLAIQLESADSVASWYARQEVMRQAVERIDKNRARASVFTPEDYIKKIKKINNYDIKRVSQEIFVNSRLNLAAIGPKGLKWDGWDW